MRHYDEIKSQWIDDSEVFIVNGSRANNAAIRVAYSGLLSRAGSLFGVTNSHCPYCHIEMCVRRFNYQEADDVATVARLSVCPTCCYWETYREEPSQFFIEGDDTAPTHIHMAVSKLAEFSSALPVGCETELAQWLRRYPGMWCSLSPRRLEELVASIFRANYADSEVIHVGRPDDGGVDVMFIDSKTTRWLVQVKRRSKINASEGVETLRNLLGAIVLEGDYGGIVVSTADHFTYRALLTQSRARNVGFELKLMDRAHLGRMLDPMLPDRPWLDFLSQYYPELAAYFRDQIASHRQLVLF